MANSIDKLENFIIPKGLFVTWLSGVRVCGENWASYNKPHHKPNHLARWNVIDKLELSFSNFIRLTGG